MVEPEFLSQDDVLQLHAEALARFGGLSGLRDGGLLSSAVAMPQASFGGEYLHPDLAEMAAAYFYHLARNHCFVDGNKRVAVAAGLVFLELNGYTVEMNADELEDLGIKVATGELPKPSIAAVLRERMKRTDDGT